MNIKNRVIRLERRPRRTVAHQHEFEHEFELAHNRVKHGLPDNPTELEAKLFNLDQWLKADYDNNFMKLCRVIDADRGEVGKIIDSLNEHGLPPDPTELEMDVFEVFEHCSCGQ